jgi:hypothetical protein
VSPRVNRAGVEDADLVDPLVDEEKSTATNDGPAPQLELF